jgi:hypothetical protein
MANRNLWLIDLGDGTWAVCCMACRRALFRGPRPVADRVFASHRCEPVLPPQPTPLGAPIGLVHGPPRPEAPDRIQPMDGCARPAAITTAQEGAAL